jgi:hypothetical protein
VPDLVDRQGHGIAMGRIARGRAEDLVHKGQSRVVRMARVDREAHHAWDGIA